MATGRSSTSASSASGRPLRPGQHRPAATDRHGRGRTAQGLRRSGDLRRVRRGAVGGKARVARIGPDLAASTSAFCVSNGSARCTDPAARLPSRETPDASPRAAAAHRRANAFHLVSGRNSATWSSSVSGYFPADVVATSVVIAQDRHRAFVGLNQHLAEYRWHHRPDGPFTNARLAGHPRIPIGHIGRGGVRRASGIWLIP